MAMMTNRLPAVQPQHRSQRSTKRAPDMSKLLKKSKSKKSKTPKAPKAPEPPQEPWHRVGRCAPVDTVAIPGIERLLAKRAAAKAKIDYATADNIAMQLQQRNVAYHDESREWYVKAPKQPAAAPAVGTKRRLDDDGLAYKSILAFHAPPLKQRHVDAHGVRLALAMRRLATDCRPRVRREVCRFGNILPVVEPAMVAGRKRHDHLARPLHAFDQILI